MRQSRVLTAIRARCSGLEPSVANCGSHHSCSSSTFEVRMIPTLVNNQSKYIHKREGFGVSLFDYYIFFKDTQTPHKRLVIFEQADRTLQYMAIYSHIHKCNKNKMQTKYKANKSQFEINRNL